VDQFGLVQPIDRLGQGVVVAVAKAVHNAKQNELCVQFTLGARGYAAMLAGTLCALAIVRLALGIAPKFTTYGTG